MTVENKQNMVRSNIIVSANKLLQEVGRDALTIRSVADAAGVQLPTIYRLFKDKVGLLDAVAEDGFRKYMAENPEPIELTDPVDEFRNAWDLHVRFGIENPELYKLMYGNSYSEELTPAARFAFDGLDSLMTKIAATGRLKTSKQEATFAAFASASGAVMTILSIPSFLNDPTYAEGIREYVIGSILEVDTVDSGVSIVNRSATTLKANLVGVEQLSDSEKSLLGEWLDRIS